MPHHLADIPTLGYCSPVNRNTVFRRLAICGLLWAALTILLMTYAIERYPYELDKAIWAMWGGIVAAPLIGIAVGYCSRFFTEFGVIGRVVLTVITLYLSGFLFFFCAYTAVTLFGALPPYASKSWGEVLTNSVAVPFWGLTWTGFVLVLGPLAYLNHSLVGRWWAQNERSGSGA